MARTAGFNIVGLILASWIVRTSFTQSINICGVSGQTVIASDSYSRTVTSPNYPLAYNVRNPTCTLLIKVNNSLSFHGYVVKVIISDVTNYLDVLKFYDGMNVVANLLGSYGATYPEAIYSTGQYLYVKFDTEGGRFSFTFSAVKEEEASGICRPSRGSKEVHWLNRSSGTFFTPDYPVPYPDYTWCIWIISVPAGKRVKLKFEDFEIERVSHDCALSMREKKYVQILDGQVSASKYLALYCGYHGPASSDVYSTGRYMWVEFSSATVGSYPRFKGFKAHFEAVDPDFPPSSKEMCFPGNINNNNLKLYGSYGSLQSPLDPTYYLPGTSCDWLITVPEEKIVKLRFYEFHIKPSAVFSCTADYVEILDGNSSQSESKKKLCGYGTPEDISSTGRYMWVRFRADLYGHPPSDYAGFKATFTAEDKPFSFGPTPTANNPSASASLALIVGVAAGGVVFIGLVCCIVCVVRKKTLSRAAGVGMEMPSVSYAAQPMRVQLPPPPPPPPPHQPATNPNQPPPIVSAPDGTDQSLLVTASLYPSEPPPPYAVNPSPSERPPPYSDQDK